MGVLFDKLANRLIAVVLEVGVVSQQLISNVFGYLLVYTCHGFLLSSRQLVPLLVLLLFLQLLDSFHGLLA